MSRSGPLRRSGPRALLILLQALCLVLPLAAARGQWAEPLPGESRLRAKMLQRIEQDTLATSAVTGIATLDRRVLAAMSKVPRHLFVPEALRPYAYNSHPLPLGHGQNLASPFLVALMTHLAAVGPDDVVFETGTGAGYHAAVLAELAAAVYSVEVVEELARAAAVKLRAYVPAKVHSRQGDGYYGWARHGPYDVMIIKESLDHLPPPLLSQLRPGGRMVVPLATVGGQYLTVVRKSSDGTIKQRRVLPVLFSPLQGGERT